MLFAFEKAALRSGQRIVLSDIDWRVREGEHWAVLGPNGSGKSTLLRAVLGDVAVVRGGFRAFPALSGSASGEPWNPPIGWVSYELHRRLIAREESLEAARWFSADLDGAGTAGELLRELAPAAGGRGRRAGPRAGGLGPEAGRAVRAGAPAAQALPHPLHGRVPPPAGGPGAGAPAAPAGAG